MYLYRCARRGEFDKNCPQVPIINGNNTHRYEDGIEYVHFFRYAKDAEFFRELYNLEQRLNPPSENVKSIINESSGQRKRIFKRG